MGVTYLFTVTMKSTTVGSAFASPPVEGTFATSSEPSSPSAVTPAPAVTGLNHTTLLVSWTPAQDNGAPISSYTICWVVGPAYVTRFELETATSAQRQVLGGNARSYTICGLSSGSFVTVGVFANNSVGAGVISQVALKQVPMEPGVPLQVCAAA